MSNRAAAKLSDRAARTLRSIMNGPRGVMYWEPAVKHLPNATVRSLIRRGLVEVSDDRSHYIAGVCTHVMLGLRITEAGRAADRSRRKPIVKRRTRARTCAKV
jgi:hypothetical protein